MENHASLFVPYLKGVRRSGSQIYGQCPFHDDRIASFSANTVTGLWNCHGCHLTGNASQFKSRLGVSYSTPSPAVAPLGRPERAFRKETSADSTSAERRARGQKSSFRKITSYVYEDENGEPLLRVNRGLRDGNKTFWQEHWENGAWLKGGNGVRRVPYRLPRILSARGEIILYVEGEKDVHSLENLGFTATTTLMGAGKWSDEYALYFKRKFVCVIPDNDGPGLDHAKQVAWSLVKNGAGGVKLVELPGLPEKGDATDFIERTENPKEKLTEIVKNTPVLKPKKRDKRNPENYFKDFGLNVPPSSSLLPHELRRFAKEATHQVFGICAKLTPEAEEWLNGLDEMWPKFRSVQDYDRFIRTLKMLHEDATCDPVVKA